MTRIKQGVFSWEDVLVQRYQSNKPLPLLRQQIIPVSEPQLQSQLLARLSSELRLMIWEFVLADQRIHIIQRSKQRLGHIVCPCPLSAETKSRPSPSYHTRQSSTLFCEICHGTGISQPAREGDLLRVRNKVKLLGLVLTCRQIYHESIPLLYTLPTLEFSNPWTLPYLLPTIPQEHLERIRTVELRWSFPGHWLPSKDSVRAVYVSAGRAQWIETCLALERLTSLRSFVLVLESNWFREPVEKLVGFLEPLKGMVIRPPGQRRDWGRRRGVDYQELDGGDGDFGFEDSAGSFSSDEESCGSLGSSRGSLSSFDGCPLSPRSGLSKMRYSAPPVVPGSMGSWELRLQGQSYYLRELDRMGDDLRRRGIDCWISAV
ncbi:hypothetical protein N7457_009146 [Penicillium paradoxum]|uniref:uncharacterized protein n=1 Tax=Penicillium paradoxum TaxID=176176 RepID=UPI002546DE9B|nr:uncharacterized protein N7457_009146 [Penicillium paradoxum]KAJ5774250.1 hypothetical protein N7457_009146 [Penicillium paradoxum]